MTGTPVHMQEPDERTTDERSTTEAAAMQYAGYRWPVLPGSAWNGRRYVVPGTTKVTDGVRPIVPRNYATTDPDIIAGWWRADSRLTPTVLLRSGLAFDILSVARPLAELVIRQSRFQDNAGPIIFRADQGRAYFLTTPGQIPLEGFGGEPGEIVLLESGSWMLVPPARMSIGVNVCWWVSPHSVDGKVAEFDVACEALTAAIRMPAVAP